MRKTLAVDPSSFKDKEEVRGSTFSYSECKVLIYFIHQQNKRIREGTCCRDIRLDE